MDRQDFPEGGRGQTFPLRSYLLIVIFAGIGGVFLSVFLMWALGEPYSLLQIVDQP